MIICLYACLGQVYKRRYQLRRREAAEGCCQGNFLIPWALSRVIQSFEVLRTLAGIYLEDLILLGFQAYILS